MKEHEEEEKRLFKLRCECALNDPAVDNEIKGYCPIPGSEVIKNDIKWKI